MADEKFEVELDEDEGFTPDRSKLSGKEPDNEVKAKGKPDLEIEIEDDTPEEDRGRQPMPKELVEKLDQDELDKYDAEVQSKLKQMKSAETTTADDE